jgi:hypothetical protein
MLSKDAGEISPNWLIRNTQQLRKPNGLQSKQHSSRALKKCKKRPAVKVARVSL